MKKKEGLIFTLFLTCGVTTALVSSFSYSLKTRLVPVLVGSVSLALSLTILAGEIFPKFRRLFEIDLFARQALGNGDKSAGRWAEKKGLTIAVLWVLSFAALLFLFGFNIAIPICVLVYVRFFGRQSWPLSLAVTAMIWLFIYGLFQVLMDYQLFEGILFGGIV